MWLWAGFWFGASRLEEAVVARAHGEQGSRRNPELSSAVIRPAPARPRSLSVLAELVPAAPSLHTTCLWCYRGRPRCLPFACKEGLRHTLTRTWTRQDSCDRHSEERQCWTSLFWASISSSAFSSPLRSGVVLRYGVACCHAALRGSAPLCSGIPTAHGSPLVSVCTKTFFSLIFWRKRG